MTRWRAALLGLALLVGLGGCANEYARYDDDSDVCRAARAPLIASGHDFQRTVLGATAIGAGVGGLAGLAIGRDWESVALGLATGALAGALTGYLKAKHDQTRSQSELLASIDADAGHDSAVVTTTADAIPNLIACRNGQTRAIEAGYASGATTRAQALAAYAGVQAQVSDDDALIAQLLGAADKRAGTYVAARADTLSLPDPAAATSRDTERLGAARREAAAREAEYQRFRANLDKRVGELERAVG